MSRRWLGPVVGLVAWIALVAPLATANGAAPATITATVVEDPTACGQGKTWCWEVAVSGSLVAGGDVEVTVVNPAESNSPHNFYLVFGEDYDETHKDSGGAAADANTGDVAPGSEESLTLHVPAGVDELYYWCDIVGHEGLGMWGELAVSAAGGTGGGGDDEESGSPAAGLVAALVGVGLAALAAGRRR